jgi:hypothetical protein
MFVVPSIEKAIAGLPDGSVESKALTRMTTDLIWKEDGAPRNRPSLIRPEPIAASRKISPEEYKDMSQWVIPPLEGAMSELPYHAPERKALNEMARSLKQKEMNFILRTQELCEAVLI